MTWGLGTGLSSPAPLAMRTPSRGWVVCGQPRAQGHSPAARTFMPELSLGWQGERNFLAGEKIQACGTWGAQGEVTSLLCRPQGMSSLG